MMASAGNPLMPSIARQIVEELFKTQKKWRRRDLVEEVEKIHKSRGGVPGQQSPLQNVKKALRDLLIDGKVRKGVYGFTEWIDGDEVQQDGSVTVLDTFDSVDELEAEAEEEVGEIVVAKVIGEGREEIYLYFNPNDRELAELKGRDFWECKIGKTGIGDSRFRIIDQGAKTALSHQPVIGLVIKTNDSAALERALHSSLRLLDAQVPNSPGTEWFLTSPERVEKWYRSFEESLGRLRGDS